MLLASTSGDIELASLIRETDNSWFLRIEAGNIQVRKDDQVRRAFKLTSEALEWAKADKELVEYFRQIEGNEARSREGDAAGQQGR